MCGLCFYGLFLLSPTAALTGPFLHYTGLDPYGFVKTETSMTGVCVACGLES
jgi:hypothetical protein